MSTNIISMLEQNKSTTRTYYITVYFDPGTTKFKSTPIDINQNNFEVRFQFIYKANVQ